MLIEVLSIVGGIILIALTALLIYRNCKKQKVPLVPVNPVEEDKVVIRHKAQEPAVIQASDEGEV